MTATPFDLSGKVAIVTGSGRGLGRAIAKGLAEAGARVVTCSRTLEEAASAAEEIRAAGGEATAFAVDVTDPADCEALVARTLEAYGRLDVMHCNAGYDRQQAAEEVEPESLRRILAVNLEGAFYCAQAAARAMMRQGGGAIVMTSSNASMAGFRKLAPYCASKGGVDQMVRAMAVEWAGHGIRVNAIAPGYMTHLMAGTEDSEADAEIREEIAWTPMRRRGRPEELVGPSVFLASDAASFVTGVIIPVDGGYVAR